MKGFRDGSRDLLLDFWDPFISWKRFKLENSNLACILTTMGTKDENSKIGERGREGSRDLLLEFWDFSISRERFKVENLNLACILTMRAITIKIQK